MQITPRTIQRLCQIQALAVFGGLEILESNPLVVTANCPLISVADLYFLATFLLTILVYISFPRSRRSDLTLLVGFTCALLAVLMTAINLKMGGPTVPNIAAIRAMELAGVVAAFLPGQAERLRHLRRTQAFRTFGEIAEADRRREARFSRVRRLGNGAYIRRGGIWARRVGEGG